MHDTEQFDRVYKQLGPMVLGFCTGALKRRPRHFTSPELLAYIQRTHPRIAPESPTRILRQLKEEGWIDYECIDRGRTLYELYPLNKPRPPASQLELPLGDHP